jgi:hypothetical protein
MSYLVVVDTTPENKIAKMQNYETRAEADAHVARVLPNYPNTFVVDNPSRYVLDYTTVDVVAKTITYDSAGFDAQKVKDDAQNEIRRLEGTVTARRMRDALASDDGKAWVVLVEDKIKSERAKL